jgi:hypothetical protein
MPDDDATSQAKPMLTPDMERVVREEVRARLRVWGIAAILVLLVVLSVLAYFVQELRVLKGKAVLRNEPVMIYNPAWDTVIDAVNPVLFPGTHQDDVRKGTRVQQWPAHGGPQHIWELRAPYGDRYTNVASGVSTQQARSWP